MTMKHLMLGGVPASLIVALVATLTKGRVHLTTDEAVTYGGFAFALGVGIAHRIEKKGLKGFFDGIWMGAESAPKQDSAPKLSPPAKP